MSVLWLFVASGPQSKLIGFADPGWGLVRKIYPASIGDGRCTNPVGTYVSWKWHRFSSYLLWSPASPAKSYNNPRPGSMGKNDHQASLLGLLGHGSSKKTDFWTLTLFVLLFWFFRIIRTFGTGAVNNRVRDQKSHWFTYLWPIWP